ncbi:ATP-binding cassette domain-containing protein [Rathayibacter soli]|uniref:ATP-binding cassette domain-containing protein n=1 Tax=Rathayibacter soli TaxID=3144168 RepID=UPI0027E44A1B|nr:ATP-binding cassette domain-containing protein [Glaciibacter superstes]
MTRRAVRLSGHRQPDAADALKSNPAQQNPVVAAAALVGTPQDAQQQVEHLGFLDQDSEMLGDLRMIESVMIPLTARGPAGLERAQELLTALAVDHVANAWPQSCSGGERQRCGVARALIIRPDVLNLDEPTASLDSRNAHRVLDVLAAARDAGTAVLVASHDNLVVDWAEDILTIEGGLRASATEHNQMTAVRRPLLCPTAR